MLTKVFWLNVLPQDEQGWRVCGEPVSRKADEEQKTKTKTIQSGFFRNLLFLNVAHSGSCKENYTSWHFVKIQSF